MEKTEKNIITEFPNFKICHLLQPRVDATGDNFNQFLYKISKCKDFEIEVAELGYTVCMDYLLAMGPSVLFDFIAEAYPKK